MPRQDLSPDTRAKLKRAEAMARKLWPNAESIEIKLYSGDPIVELRLPDDPVVHVGPLPVED